MQTTARAMLRKLREHSWPQGLQRQLAHACGGISRLVALLSHLPAAAATDVAERVREMQQQSATPARVLAAPQQALQLLIVKALLRQQSSATLLRLAGLCAVGPDYPAALVQYVMCAVDAACSRSAPAATAAASVASLQQAGLLLDHGHVAGVLVLNAVAAVAVRDELEACVATQCRSAAISAAMRCAHAVLRDCAELHTTSPRAALAHFDRHSSMLKLLVQTARHASRAQAALPVLPDIVWLAYPVLKQRMWDEELEVLLKASLQSAEVGRDAKRQVARVRT